VIIARALPEPLPEPVRGRLAASVADIGAAIAADMTRLGDALATGAPPPSDRAVFWVGFTAEIILVAYCLYLLAGFRGRRWARGDDAIGWGCAWQIFWFFSAMAILHASWPSQAPTWTRSCAAPTATGVRGGSCSAVCRRA